jgi:hypothetical protein
MTIQTAVEFMLKHFERPHFKRRIATKRSDGAQYPVDSIDQVVKSFDRAKNQDCKISGYAFDPDNTLNQGPSLIFGDVDTQDPIELKKILKRMKDRLIISSPTINNSGKGVHIVQPLDTTNFFESAVLPDWYLYAEKMKWQGFGMGLVNEFIRFGEVMLTGGKADGAHHPTKNSCLIRCPETINSKSDTEVKVMQEWNEKKPPACLLLGEFFSAKLDEYKACLKVQEERERHAALLRADPRLRERNNYYDFYIPIIIDTPLPDWREHIIALEIVPYLLTINQMSEQHVYDIAESWLMECDKLNPLKFDCSLIWSKINHTRTHNLKPMGKARLMQEMFVKSPDAYQLLNQKLNLVDYPKTKGGEK